MTVVLVAALVLAMAVPAVAGAKPAARAKAKGKPTFVSHPYTKKDTMKTGADFRVWGYINTWHRVALTTESTLTIQVQKWKGGRSWETSAGLATTATVSPSGTFKKKTNYATHMAVGLKGRYRLRASLVWTDTKGVQHTRRSSWKYIRIK